MLLRLHCQCTWCVVIELIELVCTLCRPCCTVLQPRRVQTRRLAYHHLLPDAAGAALFTNNRTGSWLASRIIYYISRLLLPKLLRVNAATAARGKERLLAEFDYLDSLLVQQQKQQQQGGSSAGDTTTTTAAQGGSSPSKLPFYLLGKEMSIAGVLCAVCGAHMRVFGLCVLGLAVWLVGVVVSSRFA